MNAPIEPRYLAMPIERRRSPYRWEVVDGEHHGKIVARCSSYESAERIAKELNEKGYVETA